MKPFHLFCGIGIALCLSACSIGSPTYFGAKYPPTDSVQTFYAAKDIHQPYKVIGRMIAPITDSESNQELVKRRLIERAKKVGANALIFSDISRETHAKTTDDFSIKAEAIIFTDK
ncbi:hypothetical protein [Pedobacter metabolipauper]|uniref:Uncharacterized protein n=1 Tax=Pedobacter metabolipauper TaxID=425513 RepID=A0A4R6SPY2_9SPHI|nr:hypothetical protein [Pedobacter metabolipauper]TDQ06219.1 hypothetical protein ATK78_4600 [Pedobacter metabolipauper]